MTKKQETLKTAFNTISIIGIFATVILCVYGYKLGIFQSTDALDSFISQAGYFGPLIFILIQIVQVVVPIIPGGITLVAGVVIFGPIYGFIYNYIGIVIGSITVFILARRYGKTLVQSAVSRKTYEKYIEWLEKGNRFDKLFTLAIALPILAPDDFLCMLAGLTKMRLKKFATIIFIAKIPSILVYSLGLTTIIQWVINVL